MIYVDIDQVARNLLAPMGIERTRYYAVKCKGMTLVEFYDTYLELLETAPETEYCKTIRNYFEHIGEAPTFITSCKVSWITPTTKWLDAHFPKGWRCKWVKEPEEKMALVGKGDYIIEDYPAFPMPFYKRVVLIRRWYNEMIPTSWLTSGKFSITQPLKLAKLLVALGKGEA